MCLNVSSNYLNHTAKQSETLLAETKNGLNLLCHSCPKIPSLHRDLTLHVTLPKFADAVHDNTFSPG